MLFILLILKTLVRQRIRTGLTVVGISIGITTVVALGVITAGFKETTAEIIHLGGADFMVAQKGAADMSFSTVAESKWAEIAQLPDVESAEGMLFHIVRVGSNPFFITIGRDPSYLAENPPPIIDGKLPDPGTTDQVLLGSRAADNLDAGVGDPVTIDGRAFLVVGIYHAGALLEDGGAYAPLTTVQEMAAKPRVVTMVFVKVRPGIDPQSVAVSIEEKVPSLTSIATLGEIDEVDQGLQVLDGVNLAISVLAVGIGAIGVMNTMIMSVFERTREIGILRAVGWSGGRIFRMIFGESLILCIVAAAFGAALGVLATRGVLLIPEVRNLLDPQYTADVFIRALIVAIIVAFVGAAYPAVRAIRLTPLEALRYE